jgi:hypothetical protein
MLCQMFHDHACQRDPKLADRLMSVPLSRIIQTDPVVHRDVRRGQIPPEYLFFGRHRAFRFRCNANRERLTCAGHRGAEWLNTAAFTVNALGTFGNLGRNRFNGPGYASTDLSLQKDFRITERFAIQFRAEAFNAFNRPNLSNPTSDLLSGNFMVINSAFDPRILQGALRLKW